jgi:hypothetical protein
MSDFKYLGSFIQKTHKIVVSDPCNQPYSKSKKGDLLNVSVNNVKTGKWHTWLLFDDRILANKELIAISEIISDDNKYPNNLQWKKHNDTISVDSGQAGIYDFGYYRDDTNIINYEIFNFGKINNEILSESGGKWYGMNCHITCNLKYSAGIIPNGVVSKSGFGDGSYDLFTILSKSNEIIGIKIVFLDDEECKQKLKLVIDILKEELKKEEIKNNNNS